MGNPPLTHLHVLLQSTGGFISEGICLYNAIRELPVELTLYNSGGISSIAVIAYLGAKNRKVSQHATFMIHRTTASPQAASSNVLRNVAHSVIIDDERTEAILREHLNITEAQWSDLRNNEFWFTAGDAVKSGLATSIGDFSPPRGQRVFSFNM